MSEPRTVGRELSSSRGPHDRPTEALLKTPTANLGSNGGSQHPAKRRAGGHGPTLADEVEHLLPTPVASDGPKGSPHQRQGNGNPTLASIAATLTATSTPDAETERFLPTPTSSDGNGGAGTTLKRQGGMNLRTAVTHLPTGGPDTSPPSAGGSTSLDAPPPCPLCPALDVSLPTSSSG
ncbi:hypothetical protein AB0O76_43770 [Streptomyces sp. NPDC086554]|uniref:hypothetical protein n=1 Tax=Streptomyces sp. NPDC086554 TaxID=3154864 RepID=UPI003420DFFA